MKLAILVIVIFALANVESHQHHRRLRIGRGYFGKHGQLNENVEAWQLFKKEHKKSYAHLLEEAKRYQIWLNNKHLIAQHNKKFDQGVVSHALAMNKFGDLTKEEFKKKYFGLNMKLNKTLTNKNSVDHYITVNDPLPDSVDWRTAGLVTNVKDQDNPYSCGSCWAFSTTGSIEGQYAKKNNHLVAFSEQQLVDCSEKNGGCEGGLMGVAFDYIKNNGLTSEASYPYKAEDSFCHYEVSKAIIKTLQGYVFIEQGNEMNLQASVASQGPVSVAIDAGHTSFQFYHHGVWDEPSCSSTELDHGVLVIGYGTDRMSKKDYWLIKNSWGPSWGEKGYVKLRRNANNKCGVASYALYPQL